MTAKGSKKLTSSHVKRYLGAVTALSTILIYPVFAEASVDTADGLPSIEIFMENFDSLQAAPVNPSLDAVIKQPSVPTHVVLPVVEKPVKKIVKNEKKSAVRTASKIAEKPSNKQKTKKTPAVAAVKKQVVPAVITHLPEKTNNVKMLPAPAVSSNIEGKKADVENKVVVLQDITRTLPAPTANIAKLPAKPAEPAALPPAVQPVPLVVKKEVVAAPVAPVAPVAAPLPVAPVPAPVAVPVKEIAALPDKTENVIVEKALPNKEDKPAKSSMFDWLPFGSDKPTTAEAPVPAKEIAKVEYVAEKKIEKAQAPAATVKTDKLPEIAAAVPKDPLYPEDLALPPVLPESSAVAAVQPPALPPLGAPQAIAEKPIKVSGIAPSAPTITTDSNVASNSKIGKEVVLSQPLPLPAPPVRAAEKTLPAITPPGVKPTVSEKNTDDASLTEPYKLASLPKAPPPTPVTPQGEASGRNQLLSLNFSKNQVTITDAEKKLLNSQLKSLVPTSKRLTIVSYASSTPDQAGSDRRISLQRAIEVRKIIIEQGIDDMRINVQAMGDTSPNGVKDHVDVFSITESTTLQ